MEQKQSKVKEFVKKHKVEIGLAAVTVACATLSVIMVPRLFDEDRILIHNLHEFGKDRATGKTIVKNINQSMWGSNCADVFYNTNDITIADIGTKVTDYYTSRGVDLSTKVTGMSIFLHK